ncbi:MFS transporter, FSR family, fosmidomycin resistance protein [Bhargavaea ginsengi]|uniref:MFS transporter, FSR family, fosmidomycin resistance protein n=1 Tax=Bhargavaea ginsengi TaxID=426757 RepID=A0A1H6WRN7_9BACL|nr:MFS transporter [Bhargavaea ginsengi]SEJ15122.1 MFS transporter, FSR family, fosmidomycin resistance protein [Bhargavaea ginsengi]
MTAKAATIKRAPDPVYPVMFAIGGCHLLNDAISAVVPAMYPILQAENAYSYFQLGLITFVLQMLSSVMQPVVGIISDKKPRPWMLPAAMGLAFIGVLLLAFSPQYWMLLVAAMFLGLGSAIFHPEGSRVAFMAGGSKRGMSQSIFQVGGNSGQALAPVITALILIPLGQTGAAWFLILAGAGVVILGRVARWMNARLSEENALKGKKRQISGISGLTPGRVKAGLTLLMLVIFVRSFYVVNMQGYYVFHLTGEYGLTVRQAQYFIFMFLALGAAGTFFGGPFADRYGRKRVIAASALIPIPLAAVLPHLPIWLVGPVLGIIGFVLMSSFSVAVVYAQELVPGKIGTMAGLTVGFAFGMGAIGSVAIGAFMDYAGVYTTMIVISLLPILGLVSLYLPDERLSAPA